MSSSTPSARSASSHDRHAWLIEGFNPHYGYTHVQVHLPLPDFSTQDDSDILMRAANEALDAIGDGVMRTVCYWHRLTGDDSDQRNIMPAPPPKPRPKLYAWYVCGYHPKHGHQYIRLFLPVAAFLEMGAFIQAEEDAMGVLQHMDPYSGWTVALPSCRRLQGDDHLAPDRARLGA